MSKRKVQDGDPLTAKQIRVFNWMIENRRIIYPPIRDVAKALHCAPATVQEHVNSIRAKGKLLV
jgi:DNA-binding CsgD family transcriptional regulator